MLDQVPAYSTNRLNRLMRLPQRYLIDSALVGPLLGIDEHAVLRDGDLLGRVIGIEIKADAAPSRDAARHLVWLQESLGDRFAAGVVFHTGPRPIHYSTDIVGLPISALWSG